MSSNVNPNVTMTNLLATVQEFMGNVQCLEAKQERVSLVESTAALNISEAQKGNADSLVNDSKNLNVASIVTSVAGALISSAGYAGGMYKGSERLVGAIPMAAKAIASPMNVTGSALTAKYSHDLGEHQVDQNNLATANETTQSTAKQGSDSATEIANQVNDVSRTILTLIANHQQASHV